MGSKVRRFESAFAEYVGVDHAVMVNSGSSANLVALSVLASPELSERLEPGSEIITPAVTWATTVYPIINLGFLPVLVDVDPETFNISPEEIRKAITPRTRAIMLVHLLGNPCEMGAINEIAREHDLLVIEDACEAHGAEYHGKKAGSFGDLATFSFFFSHHISTIQGGMVMTDREDYAELARGIRAFGWIRDLRERDAIARQYPEIDARYLFKDIGYNLCPTEIQGAFGIHQIGKLNDFVEARRGNSQYWGERLRSHANFLTFHSERAGTRHVWFGYPVTVRPQAPFTRSELIRFLACKNVETRPIMAGNIAEQPVMDTYPHRVQGGLPVSRAIMRDSFYFGNHHGVGPEQRLAIADYLDQFVAGCGKQ